MPEASTVLRRLLDARVLSAGDVVDGDVTLHDISRSNNVHLVEMGDGRRYVAKVALDCRPDDGGSPARERAFYGALGEQPERSSAVPIPKLIARADDLLVLECVEPGLTLDERFRTRAGDAADDARRLGAALGTWRRVAPGLELDLVALGLPEAPPWVVGACGGEPPSFIVDHPPTGQFASLLAPVPSLAEGLAALRDQWRPTAVVHGDVRWDNCLVQRDEVTGGEQVVLVDWEFVAVGDPGWDVAAAVGSALQRSALPGLAPATEELDPIDDAALEQLCDDVAPWIQELAAGYREATGPINVQSDLEQGAALVPAHLVLLAFQHASWEPTTGMRSALGLAAAAIGILRRPELLRGALGVA